MRGITLAMLAVISLFSACGKKTEQTNAGRVQADDALLLTASSKLVSTFSQQLKGELIRAMNEGGPVGAIAVCQQRAPEIAAANSNEYVTIRRVSDRNRNPNNLANEFEQLVMSSFVQAGDTTPPHSYHWEEAATGRVYQFYQPIRVAPLCTKCHGGEDDIEPDVRAALAEMYPDDKAIGYKPGDLRGLFVVEVLWPEGKAAAEALIGDSVPVDQRSSTDN